MAEFESLGAPWDPDLKKAFELEFERKKDKNKPKGERQYFVVDQIEVWGDNPVREYKVTFKSPTS
ncbi:MAG: hypothetical protein ACXWYS_05565 [Gaiellaceae bacterium]